MSGLIKQLFDEAVDIFSLKEIFNGLIVVAVLYLSARMLMAAKATRRDMKMRPIYWSSMWLSAVGMLIAFFNVRDTPATGFIVFYIVFGLMVCRHGFKEAMNAPDRRIRKKPEDVEGESNAEKND